MPARVWTALAGLIAVLLIAVVGLDQWQSRRGEPSLFGLSWGSPTPTAFAPARAVPKPRDPRTASPAPAASSAPHASLARQSPLPPQSPLSLTFAPRVAIIVEAPKPVAGQTPEAPPPLPADEQARLMDQLKKDPQLQRALDLLKAMKIMDKTTRPAGPPAQTSAR